MKHLLILLLSTLLLTGCARRDPSPPFDPEGPVKPSVDALADEPAGPTVTVHWDAWSPDDSSVPQTIARRWYKEYTDDLIPSPDYGQLIPYIGSETSNEFWGSGCLYGLATMDGVIVTDAVFLHAEYRSYTDLADDSTTYLPTLVLSKVRETEDGASRFCYGLAAGDGSWYSGMIYRNYISATPLGTLMVENSGDIVLVGPDGKDVFRWAADSCPIPNFDPNQSWFWQDVRICGSYLLYIIDWSGNELKYAYVDPSTGNVTLEPPADLPPEYDWQILTLHFDGGRCQWNDSEIHIYPDSGGESSFSLNGYSVTTVSDGMVVLSKGGTHAEHEVLITDFSGNALHGPYKGQWLAPVTRYIPGPLLLSWTDYFGPGEVMTPDGTVIARPVGYYAAQYGQRLTFMDETAYRITDLEGNDLLCIPRFMGDD